MPDIFTKKKRSQIMSKIHAKDTGIEQDFQKNHPNAMPHPDWLPYHPDFLWKGKVVYLDSPFWHGFISVETMQNMKPFWQRKMFRNILRDHIVNSFWELTGLLVRCLTD